MTPDSQSALEGLCRAHVNRPLTLQGIEALGRELLEWAKRWRCDAPNVYLCKETSALHIGYFCPEGEPFDAPTEELTRPLIDPVTGEIGGTHTYLCKRSPRWVLVFDGSAQ